MSMASRKKEMKQILKESFRDHANYRRGTRENRCKNCNHWNIWSTMEDECSVIKGHLFDAKKTMLCDFFEVKT